MHRFMASIAFVAAARVAFATMRDPEKDKRHLFLHAKNNLAEAGPPDLPTCIEQSLLTEMRIKTSRIVWEGGQRHHHRSASDGREPGQRDCAGP